MANDTKTKTDYDVAVAIVEIQTKMTYMQSDLKEIKVSLREKYVTKTEYEPVKKIVYGMISLVLTAVLGAVLGLVVINSR